MNHIIAKAITQLHKEIKSHQDAIFLRENAINRLRVVEGRAHAEGVVTAKPKHRKMSKAARALISAAQKKRWAEQKKAKK